MSKLEEAKEILSSLKVPAKQQNGMCCCVLHDNDIIFIDQPEDDLDNKVIYDEVITAIAQKKPYMQFIFATHNANIPVLGDSERVLVVEFQETRIDVAQGNIDLDSTHKQIVDIMEGGKEAFDKRQLIYTSWR